MSILRLLPQMVDLLSVKEFKIDKEELGVGGRDVDGKACALCP